MGPREDGAGSLGQFFDGLVMLGIAAETQGRDICQIFDGHSLDLFLNL